jgi:hypothetical protein
MRRFRQTRGYRMSVEARSLRRSPPSPRSPGRRDASISGKDDGTPATGSAHRLPSQNGVGRGPWRPSLTVDRRRRGGRLRGFRHSDGGRPGCRRRRITPATSRSSSPLAIYVQQACLSVSAVVRPRWPRALVLGVLGGIVLVRRVLEESSTADPLSVVDVLWRGVVYGIIDGALLSAFPWIVTWRAIGGEQASLVKRRSSRRILSPARSRKRSCTSRPSFTIRDRICSFHRTSRWRRSGRASCTLPSSSPRGLCWGRSASSGSPRESA